MKVAILDINWENKNNITQCVNECEIIKVCDIKDTQKFIVDNYQDSSFIKYGFALTKDRNKYVIFIDFMLKDNDKYAGFIKNLTIFEKNQRKLKLEKINESR